MQTDLEPVYPHLSPSKRAAVLACHTFGTLIRSGGVWTSAGSSVAIAGVVLHDLARDGIIAFDRMDHRKRRATLTKRGAAFAVALTMPAVAR